MGERLCIKVDLRVEKQVSFNTLVSRMSSYASDVDFFFTLNVKYLLMLCYCNHGYIFLMFTDLGMCLEFLSKGFVHMLYPL